MMSCIDGIQAVLPVITFIWVTPLMGLTNRNRLLNNHGGDRALKGFWYSLPK